MSYIVDPSSYPLRRVGRSRLLRDHLGVVDMTIKDPHAPTRIWTVQGVYAPLTQRMLGGIRLRLLDQRGYVTYLNQRDAEVLLDFAPHGSTCAWFSGRYLSPSDSSFWGFCMDPEDQKDELYTQECLLRLALLRKGREPLLTTNQELDCKMHIGPRQDLRKVFRFLGDLNPEAREAPDTSFDRIDKRWLEAGRYPTSWETT